MSKLNLAVIAIVLSCIAITLSIAQPTYNFLMSMNKGEEEMPSFEMSGPDFYVHPTFTRMTLRNNGTATAHNVRVNLIFYASALTNWEATEFIPEISDSVMIEIPIGRYQLESTVPEGQWFTNATFYEAYVHITCKELESTTSFHFENFIT